MTPSPNPFQRPTVPKNGLELLKWAIFEPVVFIKFYKNLSTIQTFTWLVRACFWIILSVTVLLFPFLEGTMVMAVNIYLVFFVTGRTIVSLTIPKNVLYELLSSIFSLVFFPGVFIVFFEIMAGDSDGSTFLMIIYAVTFFALIGSSIWLIFLAIFTLPFYLYHLLKIFFSIDFYHNPYIYDGFILLPLPTVKTRLSRLAYQQPETALAFVDFLLEYRPLQRKLAMHILHAATAGQWAQAYPPLNADKLSPPNVAKEIKRFIPSGDWTQQLARLRQQLISSQTQSNIGVRKTEFESFLTRLTEFRELTLREPPLWHGYYLDAINHWLTVAKEELDKLATEAQTRESISSNLYRPGEALSRDSANVFFGREDLRDDLARKILTSQSMPLFLIQGQRRVGKTSLLNFLPQLLGPRFKIIYQDCQDDRVSGVIPWLQDLRRRLLIELHLPQDPWQPPQDWLAAWGELREYLATISVDKDCKLILAFDEYEKLHRFFKKDVEAAEDLLGALRSFSQHQNQIVFLFVGAHLFSELEKPNWSRYFVQVERLKVDYLKKPEALRLITEPVQLIYPPDIPEQMFELTQGHPALLQKLCKEMVDIANKDLHRQMTAQDLETAINITLDRENLAIGVFWTEFCEDPLCKATVKQILAGQTPTDQYQLLRLEEHGYIIQQGDVWKMRVPLFERWLERYKEAFR
ncbi:MAG: hypothetical protein BWK78_04375 [Thiotrichaceae bacterium IS1]|nr:MAG: hypothetical protein BWK78_04375 [Thiotrichaceae bacterium IS1]